MNLLNLQVTNFKWEKFYSVTRYFIYRPKRRHIMYVLNFINFQ